MGARSRNSYDNMMWLWTIAVLTVTAMGLAQCIDLGLEIGRTHAEQYLNGVVGSRLTEKLLSEGASPTGLVRAVKNMKNLGYTDDILKLVDNYGEAFTRQIGADDLSRLGRLVNEGLTDDVVDAVIRHADYFGDYSDDTIKKIAESGCNAERILTQIDNYAKEFTEDLTAGQLKRLDDILEQGVTPEQFEVLIKHGKQLENYTDEIVGQWKDYAGNGDDFLKLVDGFGDEFVEAFQKNGDEAVDEFLRILENASDSPYLSKPVQGGILNIGAGTRPIENAYNIDINPNDDNDMKLIEDMIDQINACKEKWVK